MKEYLDNDGVCFGVDCIRSYAEIRKLTHASIKACEQLLHVVISRVKAEEVHAAALTDISQMPLSYAPGSLLECMEQLQSDTRHKANQHQILADSLAEEVVRPITLLKNQMTKKEFVLNGQYTSMNNELKQLEESFKKKSALYEKMYQTAMANVSTCRKHSITNEEYKQLAELADKEPVAHTTLSNTWSSLASLTTNTNLLATKEKGKDLLNWVVASASGTPTGAAAQSSAAPASAPAVDRRALCTDTGKALSKLEQSRVAARKAWLDFVVVSQRYAIKTQILLTKLQGMQESFVLILQDHLRKIVVVESSFLANQQYDIQMLFKVMEAIDVREDMRQFILKNAATPLDLYQSDEEEEEQEQEEAFLGRDRSISRDDHDHDLEVDIVIDQVGKPTPAARKTKPAELSFHENKVEIWNNSPWTSDIFRSSASPASKLSHIKELPLPPCSQVLSFSVLRNVQIETHLDALDRDKGGPCAPPAAQHHQYLDLKRVRQLGRIALVSRRIEKHDSFVGGGATGSLAKLDIASSAVKKKRAPPKEGRGAPVAVTSPPSPSSSHAGSGTGAGSGEEDAMSHPLTPAGGEMFSSPLPFRGHATPVQEAKQSRGIYQVDHDDDHDDDHDGDEELMSYGTAEEAIEKMVALQTRMRQHWTLLIEEFSENVDVDKSAVKLMTGAKIARSGSPALPARTKSYSQGGGGGENEGAGEEKDRESVSRASSTHGLQQKGDSLTHDPHGGQSSDSLDQLDGSDMLKRNLKDADNETENIDSVKCRDIMNSFGLLDAVPVDEMGDAWHAGSGRGGGAAAAAGGGGGLGANKDWVESSASSSSSSPLLPAKDVAAFTPMARNKFSLTSHCSSGSGSGEAIPFLGTSKSDYFYASDSLAHRASPSVTPSTDQLMGTSTDDCPAVGYSKRHFGSATPESLDFLSS